MKKISQPQLKYCSYLVLPIVVAILVAFFVHPYVWLLVAIIVFTLAFDISIAYFGIRQKCYAYMAKSIIMITLAATLACILLYVPPFSQEQWPFAR